jgi:uncharacterized membrane protein
MAVTIAVSVPMNEALAGIETPLAPALAEEVWQDYSIPWQRWNIVRAAASGITLLLTSLGMLSIGRPAATS